MTAVACGVEQSSNSKCPMSNNDDPDNTHELVQRLIVSKINEASQTPSAAASGQGNRKWRRTKQIQAKSWTCSGMIMISMLDLVPAVPAAGDDVEMPDRSDHCNPLQSRLPRIKSSLQTFMQPVFPQDSLLDPLKYFEVFVVCRSLLDPQLGSTFHVHVKHFYRAARISQTRH
jgi:hypothetical protein